MQKDKAVRHACGRGQTSGYIQFYKEKFPAFREAMGADTKLSDVAKRTGAEWKALTDSEKRVYNKLAEEEKEKRRCADSKQGCSSNEERRGAKEEKIVATTGEVEVESAKRGAGGVRKKIKR